MLPHGISYKHTEYLHPSTVSLLLQELLWSYKKQHKIFRIVMFKQIHIKLIGVQRTRDVGYLQNFSLTKYLSYLPLYVSLIRGISGSSTCTEFISELHPFLWEMFFVLFLFCLYSSRLLLYKFSYALCFSSYYWFDNIMSLCYSYLLGPK